MKKENHRDGRGKGRKFVDGASKEHKAEDRKRERQDIQMVRDLYR